jgi:membrane protein DedA with SNARE-associated domain
MYGALLIFCDIGMDCLDNDLLLWWLNQYGSIALFALLALGIVALPIPDETLIVLSGALIYNGHLNPIPTILAAYAGGMCGITISYFLGRSCGHYVIHKYGKWFGLTSVKLEKGHQWFERYGKWTLFFGYFIPGLRHFTGLIAGSVDLKYRQFALFAYSGAFLWASIFLTIGYFLGNYCLSLFDLSFITFNKVLLVGLTILAGFFCYKMWKKR